MAKKKAGPGRRECPKCHEFVGVRTATCECGHVFEPKNTAGKKKSPPDKVEQLTMAADLLATIGDVTKIEAIMAVMAKYDPQEVRKALAAYERLEKVVGKAKTLEAIKSLSE